MAVSYPGMVGVAQRKAGGAIGEVEGAPHVYLQEDRWLPGRQSGPWVGHLVCLIM